MVKIDYEPHRLHSTVKQVQKQHPSIAELTKGECSTDVKDFIYRVCSLSEKELNIEKIYLPYRRYIQIATYLTSGNYYDLNHDNLLYLLKESLDDRMFMILFRGWQHLYRNMLFQHVFLRIVKENVIIVNEALKNDRMSPMEQYLSRWIASKDPPYQIGVDCLRINARQSGTLEKRLQSVQINPESVLGRECREKFYTFCKREDYLRISAYELGNIVRSYKEQTQKSFLSNFLLEMQRDDLKAYFDLGKFFLRQTGECGTEKCRLYFSGFTNLQVEKYRIWQNLIKIRESFSDDEKDERIVFWDRYVEYGEFRINKFSQSITILFPHYCVVEFMQKTMGPIYMYRKEFYRASIGPLVVTKTNQQLRQMLLHDKPYLRRITHQGDWQSEVRDTILRYNMLYD